MEENERIQVELKDEIVSLRGKLESKDFKKIFDNNIKTLDQIISIQRSFYDKATLGYKKILRMAQVLW